MEKMDKILTRLNDDTNNEAYELFQTCITLIGVDKL
jgi:hypothetical protein